MKTLVNKHNPQIRITAPEIVLSVDKEQYWIAGIPQIPRTYLAKEWTLVMEEPTEDWREKRKKECPFRKADGCERYADTISECTGACSWVVDYPKLKELQDKKEQKQPEVGLEKAKDYIENWMDSKIKRNNI